jgi:DNA repair protein SbcC/Rad50
MRILAIRGSNLASLAGDFAVDFEAEPLASSGIFAITGPTGAGKSTLLDALCLALFAEIPRLRSAPAGSQVGSDGGDGDGTSARDPRLILRHGAGEGHAEVDFRMPNGASYRARWEVRRARGKADGRLQNSSHAFERLDAQERMGGTRTETKQAIVEVIGLSAEQFTRAVLLAQGEFEAFIRADANERALLLERLTGSEIYARIGRQAFDKAKALQDDLDVLRARISAMHGLNDLARTDAEATMARTIENLREAQARKDALEGQKRRQERGLELEQAVDAAREREVTAEVEAKTAAPRRAALERNRMLFSLVSLLEDRLRAEKALKGADEEASKANAALESASKSLAKRSQERDAAQIGLAELDKMAKDLAPQIEAAHTLDRQIAEAGDELTEDEALCADAETHVKDAEEKAALAREAHEAANREYLEAEAWCADNLAWRSLSEREAELCGLLARHGSATKKLSDQEALGDDLIKSQVARRERSLEAAGKHEEWSKALSEADERLADARNALPPDGEIDRLAGLVVHLSEAETLCLRTEAARKALDTSVKAKGKTQERLQQLEDELGTLEKAITGLEAEIPETEARHASAAQERSRWLAASDQAAQAMRAGLVEGEPCPVCGAREHALSALDALLDESLVRSEEEVSSLNGTLIAMRGDLAASQVQRERILQEKEHATTAIAEQQAQGVQSQSDCDHLEAQLRETLSALKLPDDTDVAELGEMRAKAAHDARDARALVEAVEGARRASDAARDALEKARDAKEGARLELETASEAFRNWQNENSKLRFDCERLEGALDSAFTTIGGWRTEADPAAWLRRGALQWREREAARDRAASALPALHESLQQALRDRDVAISRSNDVTTRRDERAARIAVLTQKRAALLDGESVIEVETRQAKARGEAFSCLETARQVYEEALQALASATSASKHTGDILDAAEQVIAATAETFSKALQQHSAEEHEIERLASGGQAALDAEAEALGQIDAALREAQAILEQRDVDLARHHMDTTGADVLPPEALVTALVEASEQLAEASERYDEARLAIRRDDEVRSETAALREQLVREEQAAEIWLKLREMIGDAQGSRFRRFAQGLTLDRLLEAANLRLGDLKPRYELRRGQGGEMMIEVVDNDMGGQVRGLHNLSGGERFLVSLALALGLAEMSTGRGVRIESLFIDEGFGALDPASLGQALALLEHLHASGRRVGVISHVEDLKERIPVKIEVTPTGRGTSVIEVVEG